MAIIMGHEVFKGKAIPEGVDPTDPDFNPAAAALEFWRLRNGLDNGLFNGSEDQRNFDMWRGLATSNAVENEAEGG